jgi:hypothetical protein
LTFVKGTSAVSDTDASCGCVGEVGVVEEVLDVVDGAAESAVGGGSCAADARRRAGETLSAVGTDKEANWTRGEADGGAELHDGASIRAGGAVIGAFEKVK